MTLTPHQQNSLADYYRFHGVTIRVSTRFRDALPVCLGCRSNSCEHVEAFLGHEHQHDHAA